MAAIDQVDFRRKAFIKTKASTEKEPIKNNNINLDKAVVLDFNIIRKKNQILRVIIPGLLKNLMYHNHNHKALEV